MKTTDTNNPKDNPGIKVPPPVIFAGFFLLSILLQKLIPLSKDFFAGSIAKIAGCFLIVMSGTLGLAAIVQFRKARTAILPHQPASYLLTDGLYAYTRNPMYVGLLLAYTGVALLIGNWWTIILISVLILILRYYIIRREEAYLERKFGQVYLEYKRRVGRWL